MPRLPRVCTRFELHSLYLYLKSSPGSGGDLLVQVRVGAGHDRGGDDEELRRLGRLPRRRRQIQSLGPDSIENFGLSFGLKNSFIYLSVGNLKPKLAIFQNKTQANFFQLNYSPG